MNPLHRNFSYITPLLVDLQSTLKVKNNLQNFLTEKKSHFFLKTKNRMENSLPKDSHTRLSNIYLDSMTGSPVQQFEALRLERWDQNGFLRNCNQLRVARVVRRLNLHKISISLILFQLTEIPLSKKSNLLLSEFSNE